MILLKFNVYNPKLFYILLLVSFFGCGSDKEEAQAPDPEADLQRGWQEYNSGNYSNAILSFEKVLSEKSGTKLVADAYNGLGWAYMGFSQNISVNQNNVAISLSKFQESITQDKTNSDAHVGQAGLLLIRRNSQDDLLNALKSVDNALQGEAKYLYRHDYNSEADLHALKAQCYYYLGELNKAKDEAESALAVEKDNNVALTVKLLLQQ